MIDAYCEAHGDSITKGCIAAIPFEAMDKHTVSFFVTPGGKVLGEVGIKFVMIHLMKHNDQLQSFFDTVRKLYVIQLMSPLYVPGSPITSSEFDRRIGESIKEILAT